MKTNAIVLALYGHPKHVERISGHWKDDFETSQIATYSIAEGMATIESLTPVFGTQVNLPLPFIVPVTDLGSGILKHIDINCNTLTAHVATCPTADWAERRARLIPGPSIQQQLIADYCGLL